MSHITHVSSTTHLDIAHNLNPIIFTLSLMVPSVPYNNLHFSTYALVLHIGNTLHLVFVILALI